MMTADANSATFVPAEADNTGMTHWDRLASETSWGRYLSDVERQVILQGANLAHKPGRGIDLGCGSGRWSQMLASRGWKMTCVDANPHALSLCRRNVPQATHILTSTEDRSIPAADGSAQLALCIEVVPLIESTWFLPEVRRVLASRGHFVGVYINGRSLRGMVWRLKQRWQQDTVTTQFYQTSYADWRKRFLGLGFEMLHEESCCWAPFPRDSNSPFVPTAAKMERALGLHRILTWSPWIIFIARKTSAA